MPFSQFLELSDTQLSGTIRGMNNKYCDLDPVSTQLFKDCLPCLLPFFSHIVNSSLQTGYVPSTFKKAMVNPSLKNAKLDKDMLKNFRPLSNICFFAKIIKSKSKLENADIEFCLVPPFNKQREKKMI